MPCYEGDRIQPTLAEIREHWVWDVDIYLCGEWKMKWGRHDVVAFVRLLLRS
jgi:hypothetical protein